AITEVFANEAYTKLVYALKTVLKALATTPERSSLPAVTDGETPIAAVEDDVLLSPYLLQPHPRGYELADPVQTYPNTPLDAITQSINQGQLAIDGLEENNTEQLAQYARNAWMIHRLNETMGVELQ